MRRIFRRRHRRGQASSRPDNDASSADDSSDAPPPAGYPPSSGAKRVVNAKVPQEPSKNYAKPLSPGQHELAAVAGLETKVPFAIRQFEQTPISLPTPLLDASQNTRPVPEPNHLQESKEFGTVSTTGLAVAGPEPTPGETSSDLDPHCAQKCDDCGLPRDDLLIWSCRACNLTFCDVCWAKQLSHKKKSDRLGDVAHEKTNREIAEKVRNVLTPPTDDGAREDLHLLDETTAWFGIERRGRADNSRLVLYDYGRLPEILKARAPVASNDDQIRMTPSLASFVGETGAGKSSLIKLLIDLNTARGEKHSAPIVGPSGSHHPTSEDVHLYLDPRTAKSGCPIMMVDCEGLEGGEREPSGSKFKIRRREKEEQAAKDDENYFKAQRIVSEYNLEWSVGEQSKTRGFAVTNLYPRLLYAFSDVVVFVLHNAKVIENVFEKLVTWAVNAIETSSNQPILPHVIIVLNQHEDFPLPGGGSADTRAILDDISHVVDLNQKLSKWATHWRERGKAIESLSDLIHCYYSSIEILRVPGKDRPQLVHDRVKKLQELISKSCSTAQTARSRTGMLLDMQGLQDYMQAAFAAFSSKLDSPFDFTKASNLMSRLSGDLSGNLLKHLKGVVDMWKDDISINAFHLFSEIRFLIASCIKLATVRNGVAGDPSTIMKRYIGQLDDVLEGFCDHLWPCEVREPKTYARCVNTRFGHAKGHQSKNGKVFLAGAYESSLSFEEYRDEFLMDIFRCLKSIFKEVSGMVDASQQITEQRASAEVHREIVRCFFRVADPPMRREASAGPLTSHSACFCCFLEQGEYPMPCGHVLCTPCVTLYREPKLTTEVESEMHSCPIGCLWPRAPGPAIIRLKPKSAGVRVLALDGGGVRGLAELETLKQIELALGGRLPIQAFFDLIVGTSTGGIVALGLGTMGWSVDACITRFQELCTEAFTRRKGGPLVESFHHSKYQTSSLESALKKAFSNDRLLFGGVHEAITPLIPAVKVAVTSFSLTDNKAVILSNYNRPSGSQSPTGYLFQRPEMSSEELKIWQAARATSAAPQYFKRFSHSPSQKTYLDGALRHNNPVLVADQEKNILWPDTPYPDIMLSLGTGHSALDKHEKRPPKHQLSRSNTGVLTYLQHLIELSRININHTLDCDQAWLKYRTLVESAAGRPGAPMAMFRISPDIQARLPALDETAKAKELRKWARKSLENDPEIPKVVYQLIASCFYFNFGDITGGSRETFEISGCISCRLSRRSNELSELGKHLAQQTATGKLLGVYVSYLDNQGNRVQVAHAKLSAMVNAMARNEPFSEPLSFRLKNKAAPIEMRLQFGDNAASSYFISGFPRSLLSDARPRERHRSFIASGANSRAESPSHDRTWDWKPPEHQDDAEAIDIRQYMDSHRKLGHRFDKLKEKENGLRSLLRFRTQDPSALGTTGWITSRWMTRARERKALELALDLGLDTGDRLHMEWVRFHLALRQRDKDLVKSILTRTKADITRTDGRGRTALHLAALFGDTEAAQTLQALEAGGIGDIHGWLPIDIAKSEGFYQLCDIPSLTVPTDSLRGCARYLQPTRWAESTSGQSKVVISDDGLVTLIDDADAMGPVELQEGTEWSVISDHPIPPNLDEYYFEIEILKIWSNHSDTESMTAIGVTRFESMYRTGFRILPGWSGNWGYHSDDGNSFTGTGYGAQFGPVYGPGDTVGCGVNFRDGTIYYTKNGQYLGVACKGVKGQLYPTAGFCGHVTARANFNCPLPLRDDREMATMEEDEDDIETMSWSRAYVSMSILERPEWVWAIVGARVKGCIRNNLAWTGSRVDVEGDGKSFQVAQRIRVRRVYCGSLPGHRGGDELIVLLTEEAGRLRCLSKENKYY